LPRIDKRKNHKLLCLVVDMSVVALGFVLIGTSLIIYSVFMFLQNEVSVADQLRKKKKPADFTKGKDTLGFPNYSHQSFPNSQNNNSSPQNPGLDERKLNLGSVNKPAQAEVKPILTMGSAIHEKDSHGNPVQGPRLDYFLSKSKENKNPAATSTKERILYQEKSLYYEDHSGKIIYDGSDIEIDETLNSYQKFFRIGEGYLSLTKKGITFQSDSQLFHLPFVQIKNFIFYLNCLVVITREETKARIFFPDNYSLLRTEFKNLVENQNLKKEEKETVSQKI
jgi:hypothetical protein